MYIGTCESEIFVRIESGCVVVYVFKEVKVITDEQINVQILLVPQTILHDRYYSASERVCMHLLNQH